MLKLFKSTLKKGGALVMAILITSLSGCANSKENNNLTVSKPQIDTGSQVVDSNESTIEQRIPDMPTVTYSSVEEKDSSDTTKKPSKNNGSSNSNASGEEFSEDKWVPGIAPEVGATVAETPLSNTYKLLTQEKKLTIGYIGGSITYGSSALKVLKNGQIISHTDGDIMDSWVNRVSTWFADTYPEAKIETVNAGVSDTQTSLAVYRLEESLMNTNGHDMPDLVFVEFTNNDAKTYSNEQLIVHIESLFKNIRNINPCAEIVVVSTNKYEGNPLTAAYKQVCEHYGIPMVDVGATIAKLIKEKNNGSVEEADGNFYYTVDNLHPSAVGYGKYFADIKAELLHHLNFEEQSNKLFDYSKITKTQMSANLINNPKIIQIDAIQHSGTEVLDTPISFLMYGIKTDLSRMSVTMAENSISINKGGKLSGTFNGNVFGILTNLDKGAYRFKYRIDNGEWVEVTRNVDYIYGRDYILEYKLSGGPHTFELENISDTPLVIGSFFVNG